jgi:phosphonate transport system substrate-binding protein
MPRSLALSAAALSVASVLLTPFALFAPLAHAQDPCKNRGDLDSQFCDDDRDLVADTPKDAKQRRDPATLFMSNSPQEDPATYRQVWQPFIDHMASCTGKRVQFFDVTSSASAIEAMRSGRMHIGMLSTGDTAYAVNLAGAVPFAVRGDASGPFGSRVLLVTKATSALQKPADLKGKKVAHVAPSSNSGNLAPRALLPAQGIKPDVDYKVIYSGKHENSVSGVLAGDYDAAPVVDDVIERMAARGLIKKADLRVLYTSPKFPPGSLSHAHNLAPELQKKIRDCTFNFKWTPQLTQTQQGADRWVGVTYNKDWELVRQVARDAGESYDRKGYEKEQSKAKK